MRTGREFRQLMARWIDELEAADIDGFARLAADAHLEQLRVVANRSSVGNEAHVERQCFEPAQRVVQAESRRTGERERFDALQQRAEPVGTSFAQFRPLKLLKPPFELPRFYLKQHWHRLYHKDPRNVWIRSVIASLFNESQDEWRGVSVT